jgi:hypothetical protein
VQQYTRQNGKDEGRLKRVSILREQPNFWRNFWPSLAKLVMIILIIGAPQIGLIWLIWVWGGWLAVISVIGLGVGLYVYIAKRAPLW